MALPPPGRFAYAGSELVDAHERVRWKNLDLARKIEYRDGFGKRVHLREYRAPRYYQPGSFAYMPEASSERNSVRAPAGGGESQQHLHAKFLLKKKAGWYKFLVSRCKGCDRHDVWETGHGLSGVAVEKRCDGFAYDAAMLRDGKVAVAMEVWHTHKTGKRKREQTRQQGVAFAEFDVDDVLQMEGVLGVTELTNLEVDVAQCSACSAEQAQRERLAVEQKNAARERRAQEERDRWLSETHIGIETCIVQCQEAQVAQGYHGASFMQKRVQRDQETKLPVQSCLRLVEEYHTKRHELQPDSVYESKKMRKLQRNLLRFDDCYDFVHVWGVGDFINHHRQEWKKLSILERQRKQRHGVQPKYKEGKSFKCACKKWFMKTHRKQYFISDVHEKCQLKQNGVFVIERQHDAYCYLCPNCIGSCGACGSAILLHHCVEFGFCKWCNFNLLAELFDLQEQCITDMRTGVVAQRRIQEHFARLNYDPDQEKLKTYLLQVVQDQRRKRAELECKRQEAFALEWLRIQACKAEELRQERQAALLQQNARESQVATSSTLEHKCCPVQLKRETLQNTRQQHQDGKVPLYSCTKTQKYSSELSRLATLRQKQENKKLALGMQTWLKQKTPSFLVHDSNSQPP
jgi:hypothetical protein